MTEKKSIQIKNSEGELLRLDFLVNAAKYEIEKENDYLFEVTESRSMALNFYMKRSILGLANYLTDEEIAVLLKETFKDKQPSSKLLKRVEFELYDLPDIKKKIVLGIRLEDFENKKLIYRISYVKFAAEFVDLSEHCSAYYVEKAIFDKDEKTLIDSFLNSYTIVPKNDSNFNSKKEGFYAHSKNEYPKENIVSKRNALGEALNKFLTYI